MVGKKREEVILPFYLDRIHEQISLGAQPAIISLLLPKTILVSSECHLCC